MPKKDTFSVAMKTLNMATRLSCLEEWDSPPSILELKEEYARIGNYDWAGSYSYAMLQKYVVAKRSGLRNHFKLTDSGLKWLNSNRGKIQNLKTCVIYDMLPEEQAELFPKPEEIPAINKDRYSHATVRILLKLDTHICQNTEAKTKRLMKKIERVIDEEAIS